VLQRIFLTGLSGAGKSTVGRQVANLLGWDFVDTDDLLSQSFGLSAGQVLVECGEQRFRQLESAALVAAAQRERIVIATGGGAVMCEANRTLMREQGLTVYLSVPVEVAWKRIQAQVCSIHSPENSLLRPLLSGQDGQQRLQNIYAVRKQWYEQAAVHLQAGEQTITLLAQQIVAFALTNGCLTSSSPAQEIVTLPSPTASSQAIVEWGGLCHLPQALRAAELPRRVFIVTDSNVGQLYSKPLQSLLIREGFDPQIFTVPSGEASKAFVYLQSILNWLVEQKAERHEALLALGGGVVGDLAGFVAACYHRGIPFIQVPTSLLAQVDAAIGGKTGINHPYGKNIIGAYHQPRLILVDPAVLLTLSKRAYGEGWAEIVKYGMALDADLFELIERSAPLLRSRNATAISTIITRCIQLKMAVVGHDERDAGLRNVLNYGHTFGHALETLTGYGTWLHGEAVSIGMEVAASIAVARGLLTREEALRQRMLLQTLGLPVDCSGVDVEAVLVTMQRDKKVQAGHMRWVLPTRIGQAEIYADIPASVVRDAIEALHSIN